MCRLHCSDSLDVLTERYWIGLDWNFLHFLFKFYWKYSLCVRTIERYRLLSGPSPATTRIWEAAPLSGERTFLQTFAPPSAEWLKQRKRTLGPVMSWQPLLGDTVLWTSSSLPGPMVCPRSLSPCCTLRCPNRKSKSPAREKIRLAPAAPRLPQYLMPENNGTMSTKFWGEEILTQENYSQRRGSFNQRLLVSVSKCINHVRNYSTHENLFANESRKIRIESK